MNLHSSIFILVRRVYLIFTREENLHSSIFILVLNQNLEDIKKQDNMPIYILVYLY